MHVLDILHLHHLEHGPLAATYAERRAVRATMVEPPGRPSRSGTARRRRGPLGARARAERGTTVPAVAR